MQNKEQEIAVAAIAAALSVSDEVARSAWEAMIAALAEHGAIYTQPEPKIVKVKVRDYVVVKTRTRIDTFTLSVEAESAEEAFSQASGVEASNWAYDGGETIATSMHVEDSDGETVLEEAA